MPVKTKEGYSNWDLYFGNRFEASNLDFDSHEFHESTRMWLAVDL